MARTNIRKGAEAYIEGHLSLEEWVGKEDGKKRSKTVVIVDQIQFLEKKDPEGEAAKAPGRDAPGESFRERELEDVPF